MTRPLCRADPGPHWERWGQGEEPSAGGVSAILTLSQEEGEEEEEKEGER